MVETSEEAARPKDDLSTVSKMLRFALVIAVVVLTIWIIGDVLMVVFAATLLAVILHGLARHVHVWTRLPYALAVGLVVMLIFLAIGGLGTFSGPEIADQFVKLKQALVTQFGQLREQMGTSNWGKIAAHYLPQSLGGTQSTGGSSFSAGLAHSVTGILSSALGLFGTVVVVLIAGLYFALSPAIYIDGLLRLVPVEQRPKARELLFAAGNTLWSWTIGQAFDMLAVGLASGIGLTFLGVPMAMALGVVAGLCNFIPYIGAILGAVPAVLIALSQGTRTGLMVTGLYCTIQFLEGNVLAPLIQRRAVKMPPALAILSQTLFGTILGIPGLILASPLTAALLSIGDKATKPLSSKLRTGKSLGETTKPKNTSR